MGKHGEAEETAEEEGGEVEARHCQYRYISQHTESLRLVPRGGRENTGREGEKSTESEGKAKRE